MSKSIKLQDNNYWDTSSFVYKKHNLQDVIQAEKMNTSNVMTEKKWIKLCNIKFDNHIQGEFIYIKIFIATGNNGEPQQNAYIDLICQIGWVGNYDGRLGCIAELHPFSTSFSTSNISIKVIANNNLDYDIWFKCEEFYCRPNYIVYGSNRVSVNPKWERLSDEPTGTECKLSLKSV